jgi:predicted metal-dependent hydrolase
MRSRYHPAMQGQETQHLWTAGIELFNAGRFFDCHEVWEEVWKRASGAEKLFYQGMIQAAVAILHAQRGNMRGARSTWDKARAKLEPWPAEHMGIALSELRTAGDEFIKTANAGGSAPLPKIRQV